MRKYGKSTTVVAMLVLGLIALSFVMTASSSETGDSTSINKVSAITSADKHSTLTESSNRLQVNVDKIKEMVPSTLKEAEAKVGRLRNRFLMWTHDGVHVMWGFYGNGFFIGKDNLGERCWGIYGKGVFAGFYGVEFFYGRYGRGRWWAAGLFGEKQTHGRYILFPQITRAIAEIS